MAMAEPHLFSVLSDQFSRQTLEDYNLGSDADSCPNMPESTKTDTATFTSPSFSNTVTANTFSLVAESSKSNPSGSRSTRWSSFKITGRCRHKSQETHSSGSCVHNNSSRDDCQQCLGSPQTPPFKKLCRSLSIPGDRGRWRPGSSSVWRRPANRRSLANKGDSGATVCSQQLYGSHTLGTPSLPSIISSDTANFNFSHYYTEASTPHTSTVVKFQSPLMSKSEEQMCTELEDSPPHTRPASASSGFFDSTSSSISLTDKTFSSDSRSSPHSANQQDPFRLRSYSLDSQRCSRSLSVISTGEYPCNSPTAVTKRQVHRCRSQPSMICEQRRFKRRLGEDRPSLDFNKMYKCRGLLTGPPEHITGLNTIASSPLDSNLPANFTIPDQESIEVTQDITSGRNSNSSDSNGDSGKNRQRSTALEGKEDVIFQLDLNHDIDLEQMENN